MKKVKIICMWNERFNKKESICEKREKRKDIAVLPDKRCVEGKFYTIKYSKKMRRTFDKRAKSRKYRKNKAVIAYKRCKKVRFNNPSCKSCANISSRQCKSKQYGRIFVKDLKYCPQKTQDSCSTLQTTISELKLSLTARVPELKRQKSELPAIKKRLANDLKKAKRGFGKYRKSKNCRKYKKKSQRKIKQKCLAAFGPYKKANAAYKNYGADYKKLASV